MKTYQTDNLFFGVLTGFMSSAMMLVTCVAIAQSALTTPLAKAQAPVVQVAAELSPGQPVRF